MGSAGPTALLGSTNEGTLEFTGQLVLINPNTGNFIAFGDEGSTLMINPQTGNFIAYGEEATTLFGPGTTEFSGVIALINPNTGNFIAYGSETSTLMINPETGNFIAFGNETTTFIAFGDEVSTFIELGAESSGYGPIVLGGVLETPTGGFGSINSGWVEIVDVPVGPTLMVFDPSNGAGGFGSPLVVELY